MFPYEPRSVRFIELWRTGAWRVKVYGIASGTLLPCEELVAAARRMAEQRLSELPDALTHYHTGFLGIHHGRTSNFVFLDFWAEENELHHHVFTSPIDDPANLTEITSTGLSACVWDLKLQSFERDAWVRHVLQRNDAPDFDAYLAEVLNAYV